MYSLRYFSNHVHIKKIIDHLSISDEFLLNYVYRCIYFSINIYKSLFLSIIVLASIRMCIVSVLESRLHTESFETIHVKNLTNKMFFVKSGNNFYKTCSYKFLVSTDHSPFGFRRTQKKNGSLKHEYIYI